MCFPRLTNQSRPSPCLRGLLLVLALCAASLPPCLAQSHPAAHSLYNSRLRHVIEQIPGSPTDLPPFLMGPRDVYLLVTAGGAYTDVALLANSSVPPQAVARALEVAVASTPLRGEPIEWSEGVYSVAHVALSRSRFGLTHSVNSVPTAAIMTGLRGAGWTPHLLLRVAAYAQTPGLPRSHYGSRAFRWYDATRLSGRQSIAISAHITWLTAARLAGLPLTPLLICLLGFALATARSRRPADRNAQRQAFLSVTQTTFILAFLIQAVAMVWLIRTRAPAVLADLWLGSASTTDIVPLLVAVVLLPMLFLLGMQRRAVRLFGKAPAAPAIPMSKEETTLRKRMSIVQAVPHIVTAVGVGALPVFVPRSSPLYPVIHPLAIFLPLAATMVIARIFQKRLSRFTQTTADDALTWRAREIGQTLNVRLADVQIEDSARAAHLAFASHQRSMVTLSRKLAATFTPAETDFVLAHHLALMQPRRGAGGMGLRLLAVLPLMLLPLAAFALVGMPSHWLASTVASSIILSPWFFPAMIGYAAVAVALTLVVSSGSTKAQAKHAAAADLAALEATGNLAAAESALDKLIADCPVVPATGKSAPLPEGARLRLRRVALPQAAQALRFAPAPDATPAATPSTPRF